MWLLSTDRAELQFFSDTSNIPGGYAILSHTWSGAEQTFQDMRDLRERCEAENTNPRDLASPKIRNVCIIAEQDGYQWVWVDNCCIDKTSSTELSEAINSMFRWYSCAEVCYAYLEDVPTDCVPEQRGSAFRKSRWHTRGWTLQELLAPALVIFMSKDWVRIGTKHELADVLRDITNIRALFLKRERTCFVASVAERMSWASTRQTTRVEDEAYCLLGLFGINMPTIYGEGRQAFQRLQQEIARTSFDTSLFAWGNVMNHASNPVKLAELRGDCGRRGHDRCFLFASSPREFSYDTGPVFYTPTLDDPLQPYLRPRWKNYHEAHVSIA